MREQVGYTLLALCAHFHTHAHVHTQSGEEPEPVRRAEKRWHAALADGSEASVLEAQAELMAAMLATQFGPVQIKDHTTLTVVVCEICGDEVAYMFWGV